MENNLNFIKEFVDKLEPFSVGFLRAVLEPLKDQTANLQIITLYNLINLKSAEYYIKAYEENNDTSF